MTKYMKHLNSKSLRFIALLTITALLLNYTGILQNLFTPKTALAVGELTVTWQGAGVGNVGPIFTFNNIVPGNTTSRTISVTNAASGTRPIGIKGELTSASSILANALDIKISKSGIDLYGGTSSTGSKTLAQFFTESTTINGIFLANQSQNTSSDYAVTVKFLESAGNEYQNQNITFTLKIGISFDLPVACENINFAGKSPIFGTAKNDNISGTNGNDMIIGFEGNDKIDGKNGNDCIIGGVGNDQLEGNNGNDSILGEAGNDQITGDNGNDMLSGGTGNDRLSGGNGKDEIFGNEGDDRMEGGIGSDVLTGGAGTDRADGGLNRDTCTAENKIACEL